MFLDDKTMRRVRGLYAHSRGEGPEAVQARRRLDAVLKLRPELVALCEGVGSSGDLVITPNSPFHALALTETCAIHDVACRVVDEGFRLTGEPSAVGAALVHYRLIADRADILTGALWWALAETVESPKIEPVNLRPSVMETLEELLEDEEDEEEDVEPLPRPPPPPWWPRWRPLVQEAATMASKVRPEELLVIQSLVAKAVHGQQARLVDGQAKAWDDEGLTEEDTVALYRAWCTTGFLPDVELRRRHREGWRFHPDTKRFRRVA